MIFIEWKGFIVMNNFKIEKEIHPQEQEIYHFSYHKASGYVGFIFAMFFVIALESIGVSFLLHKWSPILHWLHLMFCMSLIMFLIVDLRAVTKRPISLINDELF